MRSLWLLILFLCAWPSAEVRAAPALAVARFETHTLDPELQPLGRALADMLTTDLARLSGVTVVERAQLAAILAELDLGQTAYVDPAQAVQIGKLLNATHLVSGVLTEHESTLRVEARIVRIEGGDVVGSADVTGPRADFFLLEKQLASAVAAELDVAVTGAEQVELLSRVPTKSLEATLAWARGLDALDRGAIEAAQTEFAAALAQDETFDAARAAMDDLKGRIDAEIEARRERAVADQQTLLAELVQLRETRDWKGLSARWLALLQATGGLGPRSQYVTNAAVLAADIPDEVGVAGAGTRPTITESALYNTIVYGQRLGYDAEALAYADAFVKRYPDATLLPALQSTVQQIRRRHERRAEALARQPAIEAEATALVSKLRCAGLPDRGERQRACLTWGRGAPAGNRFNWHAVIGAFTWGSEPALREQLDQLLAQKAPDEVDYATRRLAPTTDAVRARAKREFKRPEPDMFLDQPYSSMSRSDRIAWLPKITRRWKDVPRVWSWTVVMPARDNQLASAERALAEFRERFPDADPRWAVRELEAAQERVHKAVHADLYALAERAAALDRAALDTSAAELWVQLHDTAPELPGMTAAEVLLRAASAARDGHAPDWDLAYRGLLERVVAEHAGTEQAKRAAQQLQSLR